MEVFLQRRSIRSPFVRTGKCPPIAVPAATNQRRYDSSPSTALACQKHFFSSETCGAGFQPSSFVIFPLLFSCGVDNSACLGRASSSITGAIETGILAWSTVFDEFQVYQARSPQDFFEYPEMYFPEHLRIDIGFQANKLILEFRPE